MLSIPLNEPVGVDAPSQTIYAYQFLCDYHITPILWVMCVWAYPNATHYICIHITCLVPRSNQVMVVVCLKMGGTADKEIVFCLCWNIVSIPVVYLSECFQEVGMIMASTLQGAFKIS
jgi:hypothetical protein